MEALVVSYELLPLSVSRLPHLGPKCPVNLNIENISPTINNIDFKGYDYLLVGKSNIWLHAQYSGDLENLAASSSFVLYKITQVDNVYKFQLQIR